MTNKILHQIDMETETLHMCEKHSDNHFAAFKQNELSNILQYVTVKTERTINLTLIKEVSLIKIYFTLQRKYMLP